MLAVLDEGCFYRPCGGLYGWTLRLLSKVDAFCSSPASCPYAIGQFEPDQVFILRQECPFTGLESVSGV